jgi:hypothetical protein
VILVLVVALVLLVTRSGDGPSGVTPSTSPAVSTAPARSGSDTGAPIPEPLARALDRLEQATQP